MIFTRTPEHLAADGAGRGLKALLRKIGPFEAHHQGGSRFRVILERNQVTEFLRAVFCTSPVPGTFLSDATNDTTVLRAAAKELKISPVVLGLPPETQAQ